nr:hypothetical protein GTC16762_14100 [Pigmentibacter ruber]
MFLLYSKIKLYLVIFISIITISCNIKTTENKKDNNLKDSEKNYYVLSNYKSLINSEKISPQNEYLLNKIHIAVLDDATFYNDPLLANKYLNHNPVYWDKINGYIPLETNNPDSHGYVVSKIIAGDFEVLTEQEGILPKAKIAFYSSVPDSIIPNLQHAVRQSKNESAINIRIANISFSDVNMGHLNSGVGDLRDIVIVAAAGNDESGEHKNTLISQFRIFDEIPPYNNILVAVAVDENNRLTSVSNRCGETRKYCVGIPVSDYTGKAAPILTGVLAQLMAEEPEHLISDYVNALLKTALNGNNPNADIGAGIINVKKAKLYLRNNLAKISNDSGSIKYWLSKTPSYADIPIEKIEVEKVLINGQSENVYKIKNNGIIKSVVKVLDNISGCKEFFNDWSREYISYSPEIKNILPEINQPFEFAQTNSLCLMEFKTQKNSKLYDFENISDEELKNKKQVFLNTSFNTLPSSINITNLKQEELALGQTICPSPRLGKYEHAAGGKEAYCLKISNIFKNNLPDIIKQKIYENNINELEIFFLAQANRYEILKYLDMDPILDVFRAHFWIIKDNNPDVYSNRNFLMMVHSNQPDIYKFELFKEASGHLQEDQLKSYSVHHHDGMYSPDNTHTGLSHLNDSNFSFYSLVIDSELNKAIVTLHWLIKNEDFDHSNEFDEINPEPNLEALNVAISSKGKFTISEILQRLKSNDFEKIYPQLVSLDRLLE